MVRAGVGRTLAVAVAAAGFCVVGAVPSAGAATTAKVVTMPSFAA